MIQIHLDDDTERLLKTLMDHDKEKTATGMVRSLIRDGLRERRLWPVSDNNNISQQLSKVTE